MASGERLAPEEAVVRFVSGGHIDNGSVGGSAFVLRRNESGLSINRLHFFGRDADASLDKIREIGCLTLRRSARFAELDVAAIEAAFLAVAELDDLMAVEDPYDADDRCPANPAHALIMGLPEHDSALAEMAGDLLAQRIRTTHRALQE